MARETTPKDITPIKRRGIDLTVKGLRKRYPFIIGYKDDTSEVTYNSAHYIDLIVDNNKLSEYMGVPINPYWERHLKDNPQYERLYSIWSCLKFPNESDYDNIRNHPGFILDGKVKDDLTSMYTFVPEQYRLYYISTTSILDTPPVYPVHLKVNGYLMT